MEKKDLKSFFDVHNHFFNLSHPNLTAFTDAIRPFSPSETSFRTIPNQQVAEWLKKPGKSVRNLLNVMENNIGSMFEMVEDDLMGKYRKNPRDKVFLSDGILTVGKESYSRMILTPLVMDFSKKKEKRRDESYYDEYPQKLITEQFQDLFTGIRHYRLKRPNGILEIYPFFGINTKHYSLKMIEGFLEKYFGEYTGSRESFLKNYFEMQSYTGDLRTIKSDQFSGIKFYPPLGFDPWPDDPAEQEKVRFIYDFAQRMNIPVTTHCDRFGWRTIPEKQSDLFTSPDRWEKVLKEFPRLKLNLAHYGEERSVIKKVLKVDNWRGKITKLIYEYENVYTDFSYNGVNEDYYVEMKEHILSRPIGERKNLLKHILFGTDFSIHLLSIDSYYDYMEIFDKAGLSGDWKEEFCSRNPERFLFQEITSTKKLSTYLESAARNVKKILQNPGEELPVKKIEELF